METISEPNTPSQEQLLARLKIIESRITDAERNGDERVDIRDDRIEVRDGDSRLRIDVKSDGEIRIKSDSDDDDMGFGNDDRSDDHRGRGRGSDDN